MKKVIRFSIITMFIFVAFTAMSFAAPSDTISTDTVVKLSESFNSDRSIINKPKDFMLSTTDDKILISGMGKEGDKINVSLYTRSGDEYVPIKDSIDFSIGPIGVFTQEISLKYKTALESKISKDMLVVLTLRRGDSVVKDYRLILQKSLTTLNTIDLSPLSAMSAAKP